MQIRELPPVNFLFHRVETNINELSKHLHTGQMLFEEAIKNSIFIAGPIHWHYFGFTGDVNQNFTLEISLPVASVMKEYDGKFHFKRTENFRAVTCLHEGRWESIPESYTHLMKFIAAHKLQPTAVNREIYVNVDFQNPEANCTEIQIGIG